MLTSGRDRSRAGRSARRTVIGIALGDRLFLTPLFAFIVVVEERAFGAGDLAAAVAIGLVAVLAEQRTDPRRFQLDRVERIDARLASPCPIARDATVRFMLLANGLSRQASRMINRNFLTGSTAIRMRSSENASS
jgi:hypothetical protein